MSEHEPTPPESKEEERKRKERERSRAYYAANAEKIRERHRAYQAARRLSLSREPVPTAAAGTAPPLRGRRETEATS